MSIKDYRVDIPCGVSGEWEVRQITVSEEAETRNRIRAIASGSGRFVPAGTYTYLLRDGVIVMSDTPDEIRDLYPIIFEGKGNVLINGLGLGVIVQALLNEKKTEHVTVIEISPDVIALVGEHYKRRYDGRLEIIQADAFAWKPPKGMRYDAVWHDIWDNICSDNLPEMHRLHRKYGRRADWQGSWCRWRCEQQRDMGW